MFNKIDVAWGSGDSCIFVKFSSDGCELFDYEYDYELLHNMCGGKNYYQSRSGASGAGFFDHLGNLVQVGLYRVDTAHNDWQQFLSVGKGPDGDEVFVAVPYVSHELDKAKTLETNPVVIKHGRKIIYCEFAGLPQLLSILLAGKEIPAEITHRRTIGRHLSKFTVPVMRRSLKKVFVGKDCWGRYDEKEVVIEFYDLFYTENQVPINPWEFFQCELEEFQQSWNTERIFQLLSVERLEDGTFVKTVKVDNKRYRGRALPGNPLETGELTAGWERIDSNLIIRSYTRSNEMHLVAYSDANEAYNKVAKRVAGRMGEGEEFISFVSTHEGEYVEYETIIPKVLYLLNPEDYLGEVRKGLARKVREDVMSRVAQWVEKIEDQALLDAIPDDLVITVEDSYSAGNCEPGTQAWLKEYACGRTSCTAGELKQAASNYYIMRIFRYLAVREGLIKKGE